MGRGATGTVTAPPLQPNDPRAALFLGRRSEAVATLRDAIRLATE